MKKEVQTLISQGKTKQAIQQIINSGNEDAYNSAIMLMGRWNRLQSSSTLGIISNQDISLETNKINSAVLSLLGIDPSDENQITNNPITQTNSSMEKTLLNIVKDNERSNPEVAEEAANFLNVLRKHNDRKSTDVYYDVTNRRADDLQIEYNSFLKKISENKKDSLEDFILKVKELLFERVPSYENIEKAYALCVGRGFKSQTVKDTLTLKPDDKNAKFNVIDEIENFLLTFK